MPAALPTELHSAVSLGILLLASLVGGIAADFDFTGRLSAGVLLGALALATAPATTVLVFTYVVVDDQQRVVGIIRYAALCDMFFDSSHEQLIRAEDLTSPAQYLVYVDDLLVVALEEFKRCPDDILAVVTREEPPRFVGVIRRSELTDLAIRIRKVN